MAPPYVTHLTTRIQVPLYAPGSVGLTLGRDFRQFAT